MSGSLRSNSKNTILLRALREVAKPEVEIVIYEELGTIPPFNPDEEMNHDVEPVVRFQAALHEAAAVIFSTPEYAHGMPGQLKNALDWVVGTGELSEKSVALVNASGRSVYAQASLKDVLTAMNTRMVMEAEATVELAGSGWTVERILGDAGAVATLRSSLRKLVMACGC